MFKELLAEVILLGLVVWRLSSLISSEMGPFSIFERAREAIGAYDPDSFWGGLISCLWCLSVWVAAPLAVMSFWPNLSMIFLGWLASSTVAIIIDSIAILPLGKEGE